MSIRKLLGKGKFYDDIMDSSNESMMAESYSRRSWKGIACALLVILAVAAIIAVIVVYAGQTRGYKTEGTLILDDVISGKYSAKSFNGTWVSDTKFVYLEQNSIRLFDVGDQKSTVLVPNQTLDALLFNDFSLSADNKFVLISHNYTKVYRHSTTAQYLIYNVDSKKTEDLSDKQDLQLAEWGPKGSQLVYVTGNNIWYKDSVDSPAHQVTKDGVIGTIFNGIPDWVYEEEVLASNSAIWWAPDGNKFAFIKFDDTKVPTMKYMKYGTFSPDNLYPEVLEVKYPKPGQNNPIVKLFIVEVANLDNLKSVLQPVEIIGDENYITVVSWATNDVLSAIWMPRLQQKAVVAFCPVTASQCTANYVEEESKGWVDGSSVPYFTDNSTYFRIVPKDGNFRQIAMFSTQGKSNPTFLTDGSFEVTSILYYDAGLNSVYYLRTEPNDPSKQQVAVVQADKPLSENCLTCNLKECSYYRASVSKNGSYIVLGCAGNGNYETIPWTQIRKLPDFSIVMDLERNEILTERLLNQTLCDYIRLSVKVEGGYEALVRLYVPKELDKHSKHPLLVSVYGGPGSQSILNSFSVNLGTYMASVPKYIFAEIDGRGSSLRGNKLMFEVYKRLGTVEIDDQIAVAKHLAKEFHFIDAKRMAIWGWSYGGYAAAMSLVKGNDTFKCGLSVAPVTSWYYYDSIYTERYMLQPKDNLDSYNSTDLIQRAPMFKNKIYMIIHGTGDDNVHVQQSMMLMKALNKAGVIYDTHIYPDEAHSIEKSKIHVYHTLVKFLRSCFA